MGSTMAPPETTSPLHVTGVMAPPRLEPQPPPLMGIPPAEHAHGLCAAGPDAELPSLRGFLWAVAWVVATVLLVSTYAFGA